MFPLRGIMITKHLAICLSIVTTLFVIPYILTTFGQTQTVQELKETVASNTGQIDLNTAITSTGVAGLIATVAKQLIDQKKNKKENQGTDRDVTEMFAVIGKIFAYAYVIDPHWKRILDSPVDQNPMNSDIKIGHDFAVKLQGWLDYTKTVIQAPVPNMNIAIAPVNPAAPEATDPKTVMTNTAATKTTTTEAAKPVT